MKRISKKSEAREALDKIIRKSRVHFYKPIQIAEILFRHRTEGKIDLEDLESYRNASKRWRDEITRRLIGRICTSSARFQDNLFEENAMPPRLLSQLGEINKRGDGFVEAYIYSALASKLSSVYDVLQYITSSGVDRFSLKELTKLFKETPGLRRSVDKMYEIIVYALFSTIVRALRVQITLEIANKEKEILSDFDLFISSVLGLNKDALKATFPASLYRVGVTNAADRGLDIWANFGPAVQVKHLTLTPPLVEDIAVNIRADKIVIVCLDSEKKPIEALLKQVGWGDRIQGILTLTDLEGWYDLCLGPKYKTLLGKELLSDLEREFLAEFPSNTEIEPFMKERGYDKIMIPLDW